jgi:hypothetical protein
MSHVDDASDFAASTGALLDRIDFACTYRTVTRADIQDRMHVVRGLARDFGRQLVEILPRSPERDTVAEAIVDLCQDAISALARYQDLIPEPSLPVPPLTDSMQGNWDCGNEDTAAMSPTAGVAMAPGHYVDPELVHKIVMQASPSGHMVPIDQYVEQYRKVMRALSES